jgi:hypothetical protein
MKKEVSRQVCDTLNERFRKAEADVRSALADTDGGHPLAEPARELLTIHTEIRDLLLDTFEEPGAIANPEERPEVVQAAIQIEREAHTLKPDFMDVLKALFMWKDDPVERAQNGSQ